MKTTIAIVMLLSSGCVMQQLVVDPVNGWEGHFYTESEVQKAVSNMKLQKNQSVWILSDSTLSRILKNNRKGNK